MQTQPRAAARKPGLAPLLLAFCLALGGFAVGSAQPSAEQGSGVPVIQPPPGAEAPQVTIDPAPPEPTDRAPQALNNPTALPVPPVQAPGPAQVSTAAQPSKLVLPLRNIELLNKLGEERLPTRPRHLLKLRFNQVRQAKDEKILQLLLICVGFVGVFIAILALRSVPPGRPNPS